MEFGVVEYILSLGAVIVALYYVQTWNYDYWKRKGIVGPRPVPLFGNFASLIFRKLSNAEIFAKFYNDYRDHPYIGVYNGRKPQLIVNDLDLVKTILIKDFHVFNGRGLTFNEKADPLGAHLFILSGPKWKYMRSKLSPIFTSGKLRHMIELMLECSEHFETYLRDHVEKNRVVECREAAAKFTTDVIGSCAFGINMNALDSDDSEFRKHGKAALHFDNWRIMKMFLRETAPKIFEYLQIQILPPQVTEFFISTMRQTMELRKRENIVRNDLVDILMEIKRNHDNADFEITDDLLTAQAFVFFLAGFETSSSTISFGLLELAHQPDVQEKLRDEILENLERHEQKVSYDTVKEMTYLEMVVQETLRKNPPVPALLRQASESYTIPGTTITLEKDTPVIIPAYGIHRDPKYYPDPEVFDPERFTEEAKHARHPMAHLPFGDGPKNCIGERFAGFQVKLGLIKVLKNYRVKPTAQSPLPYEISRSSFLLAPANGIHLEFQHLHASQ